MDTSPKTFRTAIDLLKPTADGKIRGACHCRKVRFEVLLSDGLNTARRCTCSFCRMRGAIAVSAQFGGITILAGEDALTEYSFNTGTAKHFFCSRCGIYTHHQRRSNPNQYGINVACLEGLSPFDFEQVPVMDGIAHPSDLGPGAAAKSAGALRFSPTCDKDSI
jgi:hypothetical protein